MHAPRPLLVAAVSLPALLAAQAASAAPFTPGNVVVVRVGNGTQVNGMSIVNLEEYTPAGAFVQQIPLPTVADGANQSFYLPLGNGTQDGTLQRSADGRYLTVAGYGLAPGHIAFTNVTPRVVARIDASGVVDTSTYVTAGTSAFNAGAVRSAVTDDGTRFWVAGTGQTPTHGVHYVEYGATGASVDLTTAPNSPRTVSIFNGQLYVSSSGIEAYWNVAQVGTGLPTTAGQTVTGLMPSNTQSSIYDYAILDLSEEIAGPDTMYVADDRSTVQNGGIQRWNFDGTAWTLAYTMNQGLTPNQRTTRHIAVVPGNPTVIYATTGEVGSPKMWRVEDAGAGSVFTLMQTPPTNTYFRGIALTPVDGAPPCPADFDASGAVDVSDIFAFLSAWFANAPGSDFDASGATDVADIFSFLSAWFAGCD